MFKILISLVFGLLVMFNARAGELLVHTVSAHSEKRYITYDTDRWKVLRNDNYGLGYKTDDGLLIGFYRNSVFKDTFYVGKEHMFTENLGVVASLATGYKEASGLDVAPIVAGVLRVPVTKKINLNVTFTPPVGSYIGVMHLAVGYKF